MEKKISRMCGDGDEFVTVQLFSTDSAGIGSCQMPTSTAPVAAAGADQSDADC